jgi:hypothetical protein
MYVVYYASMLRCWHLVWILVQTNHSCLAVECHRYWLQFSCVFVLYLSTFNLQCISCFIRIPNWCISRCALDASTDSTVVTTPLRESSKAHAAPHGYLLRFGDGEWWVARKQQTTKWFGFSFARCDLCLSPLDHQTRLIFRFPPFYVNFRFPHFYIISKLLIPSTS